MIENASMNSALMQQRNETQLNANQLDIAKRAKDRAERDDAEMADKENAVRSFQMLLATQLVKEMRKTLPNGLFGGGSGSDVYESWFDQHIASALSDNDALGMAGMLKAAIGVKEKQAEGGEANHGA